MVMLAAPPHFERKLGPDPAELLHLRTDLRSWLAEFGVGPTDRDAVVQACSEIAANSIEHGLRGGPGVVSVSVKTSDTEIDVRIHDEGKWRDPSGDTSRGRGLMIVDELMDDVSMHDDGGTTVEMRRSRRA